MTKTKNNEKKDIWSFSFIKENLSSFIILSVWFVLSLLVAFFDVAASETVLTFSLSDYEVGQVSDRTITAEKYLPADELFPFAVLKDEVIIKKGFPISEQSYEKLRKLAETPSYIDMRAFANAVLYFILLGALVIFLYSPFLLKYKQKTKEQVFLLISFLIIFLSVSVSKHFSVFNSSFSLPIFIPASFFTILITVIFGHVAAVAFSFITFFAVFFASSYDMIPAVFELCICLSAIRVVRKIDRRFDMVFAALALSILNAVFMLTLNIIFNGDLSDVFFVIAGVAFNGFISGIFALGFVTPLETLMNTASIFRLMDLSDLNSPLMKRLLLVAPGTYNHSLMVATLAESACSDIDANPLLARVGGYYHDIGKLDQPEYFVENQTGDNKHDEINPRLSASVIKSHVRKGVEKAHQLRLPDEVIDIIAEHHGNSLISYFYNEAKKHDEQVSPEEFSYSGNPPLSRESAVVMLADTVEAACRTLDKPSSSRLKKFIHQLITAKYEHGQLDKSTLTFKDLNVIESSFVTILAGYYHSRIEYPDQKDPDENQENGSKTEAAEVSAEKDEGENAK